VAGCCIDGNDHRRDNQTVATSNEWAASAAPDVSTCRCRPDALGSLCDLVMQCESLSLDALAAAAADVASTVDSMRCSTSFAQYEHERIEVRTRPTDLSAAPCLMHGVYADAGAPSRGRNASSLVRAPQRCECRKLGAVAIFAHSIAPANNIFSMLGQRPSRGTVSTASGPLPSGAQALVWCLLVAGLFATFALTLTAHRRDAAEPSVDVQPPPAWLRPPALGWSVGTLYLHNVRLYHLAARPCHVVPGHVAYTRAQNVQLVGLQARPISQTHATVARALALTVSCSMRALPSST
jgi:hypothetical protein